MAATSSSNTQAREKHNAGKIGRKWIECISLDRLAPKWGDSPFYQGKSGPIVSALDG
jgi:hypothetical protein